MNVKLNQSIAAVAVVIIALTVGCSRAEPQAEAKSAASETEVSAVVSRVDSRSIARGQEVFETTCAKCHTVDGRPVKAGPDLSDFGNERWSKARVIDTITDFQRYYPGSNMPTWDESYPARDIEAVADYIMSLEAQAYYIGPR